MGAYHPDAVIDAEVAADALAAERADLAVGYPPRRWTCPCGASHGRGHFMTVGVHRCLRCGYVGCGGAMWGTMRDTDPMPAGTERPEVAHNPKKVVADPSPGSGAVNG